MRFAVQSLALSLAVTRATAWVATIPSLVSVKSRNPTNNLLWLLSGSTTPTDDEGMGFGEDCDEDGECEIDWDNMPGFADDDDDDDDDTGEEEAPSE